MDRPSISKTPIQFASALVDLTALEVVVQGDTWVKKGQAAEAKIRVDGSRTKGY